jgi:hypothetical protein
VRRRYSDFGEACSEVVTVLGVKNDILALLVKLEAIAIELAFMHPAGADRRLLGQCRQARLNEGAMTEHYSLPLAAPYDA